MTKCPYCAEEIQDEAILCRYCQSDLSSSAPKQPVSVPTNAAANRPIPESHTAQRPEGSNHPTVTRHSKRNVKTVLLIVLGIVGFVIGLWVINRLNTVTEDDLREFAAKNDVGKLIAFVQEETDHPFHERRLLALRLLCQAKDDHARAFLENEFFETNEARRAVLFGIFQRNNFLPNQNKLWAYYIDAATDRSMSKNPREDWATLLRRSDSDYLEHQLRDELRKTNLEIPPSAELTPISEEYGLLRQENALLSGFIADFQDKCRLDTCFAAVMNSESAILRAINLRAEYNDLLRSYEQESLVYDTFAITDDVAGTDFSFIGTRYGILEQCVVQAKAGQIPDGPMQRFHVDLVIRDKGYDTFRSTNGYGEVRTKRLHVYEVVQGYKQNPLSPKEVREQISALGPIVTKLGATLLKTRQYLLNPSAAKADVKPSVAVPVPVSKPDVKPSVAVPVPKPNLPLISNSIGMEFILVQPGTFQMGSTDGGRDEEPIHSVTLSNPFYIGKYEVTQKEWGEVMGTNPSAYRDDDHPVEMVNWSDAQVFIRKLNEKENTTKYRLPTEAEWEFAARGGTQSSGYMFSGSNNAVDVAVFGAHVTGRVGSKQPNELGIYDMSGNVLEWCQDWFGMYGASAQTDPKGPTSGTNRVSRGGSATDDDWHARVTYRLSDNPLFRDSRGFRCVRGVD